MEDGIDFGAPMTWDNAAGTTAGYYDYIHLPHQCIWNFNQQDWKTL